MEVSSFAFTLGRLIVGAYYLMNAFNHFTKAEMMAGYAGSKGIPSPKFAVLGSGALLAAGGLSILTGIRPDLGVAALVIFFLPVTILMHNFWQVADPMARIGEMVNFMKNLALLGSALMLLQIGQPWPGLL